MQELEGTILEHAAAIQQHEDTHREQYHVIERLKDVLSVAEADATAAVTHLHTENIGLQEKLRLTELELVAVHSKLRDAELAVEREQSEARLLKAQLTHQAGVHHEMAGQLASQKELAVTV